MRKKALRRVLSVIYIISLIALTFVAIPFFKSFEKPEEFKAYVEGFGVWGFLIVLFIQISQIVVALIPGEFVEFIAGAIYGWLGGLSLCLAGIAIGQIIIFYSVKILGKDFIELTAGSKAMQKFKFLQDEKKLKTLIFILFFIPGTPKDLITYAIPFTKVRLKDFILISLLARIPSVVSSTYAGDLFVESNFKMLLITYGFVAIFSLIGFIIYKTYEKLISRKNPLA